MMSIVCIIYGRAYSKSFVEILLLKTTDTQNVECIVFIKIIEIVKRFS